MYLKRIDMFGFKSFAKKMVFEFDGGITAIVGPNGSGKSNIADAIRWVLGEQSAKSLRGAKMQDVIFAGTENRKPLGYCQVDLTIDNQDLKMPIDYTEVTVSRRVYRSGESEFYINGTACRLKDIHEFFLDTGVGKEGYSIIGQGQIDKILSTKPDDRRALFDEAAGIVKFKVRKKNAQKKLDDEKQHLTRINDIIRELEERQDILEEQAKVAKEYLSYKEDLKRYEVNIFLKETEKLQDDIKKFTDKEDIVNNQIKEVNKEIERYKEEHTKLYKELEAFENEIELKKEKATEHAIKKEKTENNIQLNKVEIGNIEKNNIRINEQLEDLNEKERLSQSSLSNYENELKVLTEEYSENESVLSSNKATLSEVVSSIEGDEAEIENIKTNIIERLNEISSVKTKIQRYKVMVENIEKRKDVIESRQAIIFATINQIQLEVKKESEQLDRQLLRKEELGSHKENLNEDLSQHNNEIKALDNSYNQKRINLSNVQSKLKALNDLSSHYEGYNISIKRIMEYKNRNNASGIIGVVADIISVNKDYELAIETALGASIQNIVTKDENTAKEMIQYLKKNRYGRATFLPLNTIKARETHKKVTKKDEGFLGYANELVQTEAQFSNVINSLLGHVVVVDHIDNGIRIAKKNNYSVRIVTTAGEIINPGGSLTGGAYKNKGNQFLSRKREIAQYEEDIKTLSVAVNEAKIRLDELREKNEEIATTLKSLSEEENKLNLSINSISIQLKQYENEHTKHKEDIENYRSELDELLKQRNEMTAEITGLESSLDDSEGLNKAAEDSVKSKNDSILELRNKRDELSAELTTIQVTLSSLKQQIENKKENTMRINEESKSYSLLKERYHKEIEHNIKDIHDKKEQINALNEALVLVNEELVALHENTKTLNEERLKKVKQQEELYKKREEKNDELNLLDKDLLRIQNAKYKLETSREVAKNHIWDEYELTYNNALYLKEEDIGALAVMRKMVNALKQSIKNLGTVNVNSIEEYKTVSERYEFLTVQRDDLIEAEEKLKDVIADLDVRMQQQFKEKFKEITVKFNEVFRELFGGGKGILQLTENDDVLESGIEIIAQPPGKKLQSMMLLSGGEKAFTAIALLFAIQTLKPSPFCVLDEIEAALDDANVFRFANYLKKLTKSTQFILITHRRGTMEAADSLYGITMQEKGVSTQVSVKLIEDNLED